MEREMQQRLNEPLNYQSGHVRLTEFPVYGEFVNPGIGIQMYDFLVPLYGTEHFNTVKETSKDPGSITVPICEKKFITTEKDEISQLKQEGFGIQEVTEEKIDNGDPHPSTSYTNTQKKIEKLGPIFSAMKKAKVQTSELQYKPKKQRLIGVKKSIKNKFHLV